MEILNLFSGASLIGNVSQLTGNQTSSVEDTGFYKQLMGVVTSEAAPTENNELAANQAVLFANTQLLLNAEEMTGQELELMIEGLLDQLDQLNEQELDEEQQNMLMLLLEQVTALVEMISFSNDQAKPLVISQNLLAQQQPAAQASDSSANVLVKLADQLLLLQQQLQQNGGKLLFGQPAEVVIAEQVKNLAVKMEQLVQSVQQKPNDVASAPNPVQQIASTEFKPSTDAANHQVRMTEQSVHKPATVAMTSENSNTAAPAPVVNETPSTAAVTPEFQLRGDTVREFLLHMNRGTTGASSAFVLADEFAETMKELVVQRFNVSSLNGITEARLSLTPEHLGHVDVKISMQNGVMTAIFQTETAMAKDVLENQMIHLRASLAAQGITVEKIEVAQTQTASELDQQPKQGSSANQHEDGKGNSREKEKSFEEELLTNVTNQELGFGRAVNEIV